MHELLLIGLGGGLGSIGRYLMSEMAYRFLGRGFPYGTLLVNAIGSFLIGLLIVILLQRASLLSTQLRAFLVIGLLGGFTTFSTFSFETVSLIENGDVLRGALNILLSIGLCLTLTWLGIVVARLG